jgi:saccharopine dehydrogenase (NADP+, L-glutamate forming)
MKKVLLLGSGMVVKPMVEYLLENGFGLMIASPMKDRADEMIKGNPLGSSIDWSMDDHAMLEKLVSEYDITVSLLPYRYHVEVARVCLKCGKSLVTTSYVQPDMKWMEEDVEKAGIIFLNEMGLDPGIDHMSAMKIIDYVHDNCGRVEEFYSLCGALPAPEAADNPFRYKFSWSPKGVILAGLNRALYLKKGKEVFIETADLFKDRFTYNFPGVGELEVYPNRDSISYSEIYGIPETTTMYRGTFRYKGWCESLDAMKNLKMFDDITKDYSGMTCSEFLAELAGTDRENLKGKIAARLGVGEDSTPIEALDFLGFFNDEKLDYANTTPFEITSDRMISRMLLSDNERDMVLLKHIIMASYPSGRTEVIKSAMIDYGIPGENTAIARTVALPAAIAVKLILEKKIDLTGVHRPVIPQIYTPVLNELKKLGIEMKEEFGLPKSEMIL